jgi:hypothetical protein
MIDELAFIEDYQKDKKNSTSVLKSKYGVSETTLSLILKKHGIKARRFKSRKVDKEEIMKIVEEQKQLVSEIEKSGDALVKKQLKKKYMTQKRVSELLGISFATFRFYMKDYGLIYPKVR